MIFFLVSWVLAVMVVRLQLGSGKRFRRARGKNRQTVSALGALLMPIALMAYVMGVWRLASEMGFAGEFAVDGLFSHWQVWMVLGAAVHLLAYSLTRYGRSGLLHVPRLITVFPIRVFPGRAEAAERRRRARGQTV
jgi:hypothetical protein